MTWWRNWERNGNSLAALLSGNAQRRPKKRDHSRETIITDVIKTHYCQPAQPTIIDTTRVINNKLLLTESPTTVSMSTVRRRIGELDKYAVDAARFGSSYARNKWRYSMGGINAPRAMSRYEIDHTLLDIVAIDDRSGLPLGRPTITICVDSFSGYPVGIFVSFWGASLSSVFSCMKVAIAPKILPQKMHLNIESRWLGHGIFQSLVMDNGLEFHSPQLHSVAMELNIDMIYCPVRQPWFKPVVERTLGDLYGYFPPEGRVAKPQNNYIPPNPDKTASITFSSLRDGLLKALLDVHARRPNERKLATPYDLFGESFERLPPPAMPTSLRHLDIIVGHQKSLTVGNEGVVSDYIRYNSRELQDLRRRNGHKFKTAVKFDPANINHAFVKDPSSSHWLTVPSCYADYTNDLSLVQHKAIRNLARDRLKQSNAHETLVRGLNELKDYWGTQVKFGKRLRSSTLRKTYPHTDLPTSTATPIELPEPSLKTNDAQVQPINVITESDLRAQAREIPAFSSVELF